MTHTKQERLKALAQQVRMRQADHKAESLLEQLGRLSDDEIRELKRELERQEAR